MDFLNKAKDFLEENNKPQGQQSQQQQQQQQLQSQQSSGDQQFLPPGNKAQGGAYTPFGGDDNDLRSAAGEASRLAGSSGDKDLFSGILGALTSGGGNAAGGRDVDEAAAVSSHQKFVGGQDGGEKADEQGLGAAAAVQALKLFNQGGAGGDGQKDTQGGFLALALAEASKLFDDKQREGKLQEGTTKQGVVREAGEVALKLFLKNQAGGSGGAGGGVGGLADIAGKLFK